MAQETHNFIHNYNGLGAFGLDKKTDQETIMFYLQKFSEDAFMAKFIPRLEQNELEEIYLFLYSKLRQHLSEDEYHSLFLKDR